MKLILLGGFFLAPSTSKSFPAQIDPRSQVHGLVGSEVR